jgi:hypothetical protein
MRTSLGFSRHRLATLIVAGVAISVWGLNARAASAQGNPPLPDRVYSTGPFQLHDGERVLVGLLLPAVQRAKAPASFLLLNGQGMRLWVVTPGPPNSNPNASFFDSFFDITYRAAGPNNPNGGAFEIRGKGVPGGGDIVTVPSEDGILIGLLLPAVQRNGKASSPLATSMQSFDATGRTMTHSFFDVFSTPGPLD